MGGEYMGENYTLAKQKLTKLMHRLSEHFRQDTVSVLKLVRALVKLTL